MKAAIQEMNRLQLGLTLVLNQNEILTGIITDGDLRRIIMTSESVFEMPIRDVMTSQPRTLRPDSPVYDALNIMEKFQITVMPVTAADGTVQGVLHLHDILGKGEFKFNGKIRI
jgi:arabinose-5-phosphate isomerase